MSKTSISDHRIKIKVSTALLSLIHENIANINELPENVAKALKDNGYDVPTKIEIVTEPTIRTPKINMELLKMLSADDNEVQQLNKISNKNTNATLTDSYLYLYDLKWLNSVLVTLRKEHGCKTYLHELLELSALELPQNEIIARNPQLEARCQKLREDQMNREYRKMTKEIDPTERHRPEDSIAYQMKTLNAQIIAVLQFVFSVVAGFVFGFLGIELIIGNLDFGLRLLLGIMFALIIALAEIYFLAKKLNEYDDIADSTTYPSMPSKSTTKVHTD